MKKQINAFDYAGDICKVMPKGILMTTKCGDKVNTMTIGWGHIGVEKGKPIFIAYVLDTRYTKELLDATGEFTVNAPMGSVDSKILIYCGTKSGRDTDKIKDLGLTLEDSVEISVPGIKELPLTLECKVLYAQNHDEHTVAYHAQILNAYIVQD